MQKQTKCISICRPQTFLPVIVASMIWLLPIASGHADMIVISAVADGDVNVDETVDDTDDIVVTQTVGGGATNQRRGVFEFDLSSIPDGATIDSVSFSGHTNLAAAVGNMAVIDLTGFVGTSPAQVTFSDFGAAGVSVGQLLQANGDVVSGETFEISLTDLSTFQTAFETSSVFGIRSLISNSHSWWVRSSEHPDGPAPTLTINYTSIPEPSSAIFMSMAMAIACVRRGGNRRKLA